MTKFVKSLREVIELIGLKDGMTISFHHHLRNGDYVLNMVMDEIDKKGIRDLTINASSIFNVHLPIVDHIKNHTVTKIQTSFIEGEVGNHISEGILDNVVEFRTHGGRAADIISGTTPIDVAFIAASASDVMGNCTGKFGDSAFGSIGYAFADVMFAKKVVVITDNLHPYPLITWSIPEVYVDYVVEVEEIGDPNRIVSGTTKITKDPIRLYMAELATEVIEQSGYLKEGLSFQTGAGGSSLAVSQYLKSKMKNKQISGSFALGGITGYLVDMLDEGYFKTLFDVQCFDLKAVESINTNKKHQEISAFHYASPNVKSAAVDNLDIVILGATEIDTEFNVNVHTGSNGSIMGGSGGHSDAAAGAKLTIIIAPLTRLRIPIIRDKVLCVSTPGKSIDVLVTQKGIAINPLRKDLQTRLMDTSLPILDIFELKEMAEKISGIPAPLPLNDRVIAEVIYRDGTQLDKIHKVNSAAV